MLIDSIITLAFVSYFKRMGFDLLLSLCVDDFLSEL